MAGAGTLFATYRLQLNRDFPLDRAAEVLPYLKDLGVSHVHLSPILQAAPGSTHGYDMVDPSKVSDDLGGDAAFARFANAARRLALGIILDIVPNHMSVDSELNRWWTDVLALGPASPYARFFDLDWNATDDRLRSVILLPVLGDHYGRVLNAGGIAVIRDAGREWVTCGARRFPLAPDSLEHAAGFRIADAGDAERAVAVVNADVERLHSLLEMQHYRLAWWRVASQDLTYRRFFDVNSLAGVRVEDPAVFAETHARVIGWLRDGVIDGVRVDHVDGLRDPAAYCERLRAAAPDAWIIVEKILAPGEELPDWPVDGTTGYDFMTVATGLLVDPGAEGAFTRIYDRFTGGDDCASAIAASKEQVLRQLFGSDVTRLTALLAGICESHREYRDYSREDLAEALRAFVRALPVYRTYKRAGQPLSEADARVIAHACASAIESRPDIDPRLFDFLHQILDGRVAGAAEDEFVARLQQFTGAAAAKGVEDTAFYRYGRLLALNEVGADPCRFGTSPEAFHAFAARAIARGGRAAFALSTHDTKRSDDVRARLAVLTGVPERWEAAVNRWRESAAPHRTEPWPDASFEYDFFQTLIGAWPLTRDRALAYVEKAVREAKRNTSWTAPSEPYESAVRAYVTGIFDDADLMSEIESFVQSILPASRGNSLAQLLWQLTSGGIPDVYQGSELWNLTLVDPDNRRPVDWETRRSLLRSLPEVVPADLLARDNDGMCKLLVLTRALALRRRRPELFCPCAPHTPIAADGSRTRHAVIYKRGDGLIAAATRLSTQFDDWADTTVDLPPGRWANVLAHTVTLTPGTLDPLTRTSVTLHHGRVPLSTLLGSLPVALLERMETTE